MMRTTSFFLRLSLGKSQALERPLGSLILLVDLSIATGKANTNTIKSQ